ncbi:H/ACA ribonucleoprotein complex non-core subunit NAF1-like [Phoenix dactylifera]|uniref:H/ACA ribonucleoprotein complex non-core subunit NAF1 n=1 Tax=Phoenix dactylifera TaxID=42345 RepID=A0A8B7BHP4_PHODC|nr:H/ACA ribonucleoprotein complex non-core subunit NAF1-like [Phoenix dactylifera]
MDSFSNPEPSRNPSSIGDDAGAGAGEPDPSPESLAVEPDRAPMLGDEANGSNQDGSDRKSADLELAREGFGASAVNPDGSGSKSLELGSPIDRKMEKVSLIGPSDPADSKEDRSGVPMAVNGVPVEPPVDGSAQTSKGEGSSGVSLATDSRLEGEDDGADSSEDGADSSETKSEESGGDDSSSEESSSSSSEEEDEDGDSLHSEDKEDQEEELVAGSDGEEEAAKRAIRSKHEPEVLPPVPPVEVTLEPHHQLSPLGTISSILGTKVIVEGSVNHNPLNEGSIIWKTDTRSPLGLVDEIFGPVKCPYYVVRYNSDKDVPVGISEGTAVSFVMEFANNILSVKDLYKKGYDASGENDEEITEQVEFSDDEKEAEYKRYLHQEKRGADDKREGNCQNASRRKKTKSKGTEPRKGLRPLLPRGPVAMNQVPPGVSGPLASLGANNSAYGRGTYYLGAGSACGSAPPMVPAVPQAMNSGGCPPNVSHQFLQQQPNSIWAHSLPPQQQPNAFWPYGKPLPLQQQPNAVQASGMPPQQQLDAAIRGFQMNASPSQQLGNHVHHQQHQNQVSNSNMNMMPSQQQQFVPLFGAPTNMPWPFRPLNVLAGPVAPLLAGPVGISQASSGQGNISAQGGAGLSNGQSHQQHSPTILHAGMLPPLQYNFGSSSVRGRKLNVRGGGHSFGRGAWRRKG